MPYQGTGRQGTSGEEVRLECGGRVGRRVLGVLVLYGLGAISETRSLWTGGNDDQQMHTGSTFSLRNRHEISGQESISSCSAGITIEGGWLNVHAVEYRGLRVTHTSLLAMSWGG